MSKEKAIAARPQATNANRHTPRGMGVIEGSISQYGWIGAPTIANDGEAFDGSARIEIGAALGFDMASEEPQIFESDGTRPVIIRSNGNQPIIHQRTDIPTAQDPRAVALGVIANRSAALNLSWEPDVLAGIADAGIDLGSLFTAVEWADVSMAIPDVEFKEYTEDVENEVKYCTCPECGAKFPA